MTSSGEANKDVVRRFYAAFGAGGEAVRTLLHPAVHVYQQGALTAQDAEQHLAGIDAWNVAFSATRFEILGQVAEEDVVATQVVMHAVHDRAPFSGREPSGAVVSIAGMSCERVEGGLIVERRVVSDGLGMLRQLGALP